MRHEIGLDERYCVLQGNISTLTPPLCIDSDPTSLAHPSDYPWSSYLYNAFGNANELVSPHLEYLRMGKTEEARQAAYRQLFMYHLAVCAGALPYYRTDPGFATH